MALKARTNGRCGHLPVTEAGMTVGYGDPTALEFQTISSRSAFRHRRRRWRNPTINLYSIPNSCRNHKGFDLHILDTDIKQIQPWILTFVRMTWVNIYCAVRSPHLTARPVGYGDPTAPEIQTISSRSAFAYRRRRWRNPTINLFSIPNNCRNHKGFDLHILDTNLDSGSSPERQGQGAYAIGPRAKSHQSYPTNQSAANLRVISIISRSF